MFSLIADNKWPIFFCSFCPAHPAKEEDKITKENFIGENSLYLNNLAWNALTKHQNSSGLNEKKKTTKNKFYFVLTTLETKISGSKKTLYAHDYAGGQISYVIHYFPKQKKNIHFAAFNCSTDLEVFEVERRNCHLWWIDIESRPWTRHYCRNFSARILIPFSYVSGIFFFASLFFIFLFYMIPLNQNFFMQLFSWGIFTLTKLKVLLKDGLTDFHGNGLNFFFFLFHYCFHFLFALFLFRLHFIFCFSFSSFHFVSEFWYYVQVKFILPRIIGSIFLS